MTFTLRITSDTMTPRLRESILALSGSRKRSVLNAMGRRFWQITRDNFGVVGYARPEQWRPLSQRYMKMINYYGPPKLVFKGSLRNSIKLGPPTDNSISVFTENPYATSHQFGAGRIPDRPYFPVIFGGAEWRLTPVAEKEVVEAGQVALNRVFEGFRG